jgi:hypothetical protein
MESLMEMIHEIILQSREMKFKLLQTEEELVVSIFYFFNDQD